MGTSSVTYVYDSANQLIRENNQAAGKTWAWTYDDAGNVLNESQYVYTTGTLGTATVSRDFTYGDGAWGDLLTNWHGYDITYDEIGNVLSDRDSVFTWEHGRELTSMTAVGFLWQFTYDQNGMRTSRTNGNRVYNYVYNGDSLSQVTVDNHDLNFTYDTSGKPLTLIFDGTAYWYDLNLQGDVVGILDSSGNTVVGYTYNAWGCILSITGSEKDTVGFYNPLRYRGYVWDPETGLYYLQSRYYNPGLGRFINADAFTSTGQGLLGNNMFAYCNNNPVNMEDPTGEIAIATLILIGSAIIGAVSAGYTAYTTYKAGWDTDEILWYTFGAGLGGFLTVYTFGMSAYQVYLNYCMLNGITPVTEINGQANVANQLQKCANTANSTVDGNGPVAGTQKHTAFANEVNNLGNSTLRTEVSYMNGSEVPYGTKGSIRFDVVQVDRQGNPVAAWDFKTGSAILTPNRIAQMQAKSGLNIPIQMIKRGAQ